ncbi:MAG: rhomboid family intramembrane serine protease [Verrucomicrobiota bacterium]
MLENRDYMRDRDSGGGAWRFRWSACVALMVVLTVIFALQCINDVYINGVEGWLALTPFALMSGYVWQFLTFQFLHVSLWHLICNLLGLWFFGRFIESVLGTKRFLVAYFACGVIGGLLQCALMIVFPNHFAPFVYGASAGGMGIFAIFCKLQSDSEIRWNFILPIRAEILLWITAGISLFFTLVPSGRGGFSAHAAHLGGIIAGLAWVKLGWHRDFVQLPWENWFRLWRSSRPRQPQPELLRSAPVPKGSWRKAKSVSTPNEEVPSAEFISQEVDPILDKISAQGIHSLTDRERQILDAARKKMARK